LHRKKLEDEVARIEKAQDALRESIDQTQKLAARADELLQKHKATLESEQSSE
jgi:hypothetical protein